MFGYGREGIHWSNELEDKPYRLFARKRDAKKPHWSKPVPIVVRAMILAGDVIFAAGANPADSKQSAGAQLVAFAAADGAKAARHALPARPVFNGMAAADGQLFLALEDGRVVCMGAP